MNIIEVDGNYTEECYVCIHKRQVKKSAMISCDDPDEELIGHEQGIKNGWFNYPSAFDPVWIANKCRHFSLKDWEKEIANDRQTLVSYLETMPEKQAEWTSEAGGMGTTRNFLIDVETKRELPEIGGYWVWDGEAASCAEDKIRTGIENKAEALGYRIVPEKIK